RRAIRTPAPPRVLRSSASASARRASAPLVAAAACSHKRRESGEGGSVVSCSSLENAGGDHDALDLARAFVDFGDARVAVVALHGKLRRVAVAAVDLDGLVGYPRRHFAREELRFGALHRVAGA